MVNLSPSLRSLRKNGLRHLLFQTEDRRNSLSVSLQEEKKSFVPNPPHGVQGTQGAYGLQGAEMSPQKSVYQSNIQRAQGSSAGRQKQDYAAVAPHFANEPGQSAVTQMPAYVSGQASAPIIGQVPQVGHGNQVGQKPKIKKNPTLILADWPESWMVLHRRFQLPLSENPPAQTRVVWTYAGLEQDALGVADENRQKVIRKLLGDLNHKGGSHNFVPYSVVHEDGQSRLALEGDCSFFWSAMRLVQPRVLLVFGFEARDALSLPKDLTPLQKTNLGALQVLQMFSPESLAADNSSHISTFLFLQEYLKFIPKRQA